MEGIQVTAKELLFCAAKLGATAFHGIADPFFGMTEDAISRELAEIPLALDYKGYATVGFEDEMSFSAAIEDLVGVCAFCEQFISFRKDAANDGGAQMLFYRRGEKTVAIDESAELLRLAFAGEAPVAASIVAAMAAPSKDALGEKCAIQVEALSAAQAALSGTRADAASILLAEGASQQLTDLLVKGLSKETAFCTVTVMDNVNNRLRYALYIITDEHAVHIEPDPSDEFGLWNISTTHSDEIKQYVAALCDGGSAL